MKSATYFLVGALVVIAIIAILKKYFFEVADYDLATQSNALKFGIEGYEDAEASETKADDEEIEGYEDEESETKADDEEIEGYEDEEEDEEEVEHMTTAAKDKRETKKRNAKLRAEAKKTKAYKLKADKMKAYKLKAGEPKAGKPGVAEEKFENTPRFQELKAKWDAYKANKGPALTEAERKEMLVLLDMPNESATQDEATTKDESLEQFEETPYQGMEYAMF